MYYDSLGIEDDGKSWNSCIHYNIDLMKPSVEILHGVVWFLIILSLVLDIGCYKYRHLAQYYIYYQFIHLTVARMLPNPEG